MGNPVEWKGHVVYTNLEELKGFPERTGAHRDPVPNHGMWPEKRRRETAFEDREPAVVVIGGGQSGLEVSARLKLLGVPTLIVEKQPRIGNQWRGRYEALCLHDPVWYDHMPYIPFPPSWPMWTPAPKLADWLESYAKFLELDIWLSATVDKIERLSESGSKGWRVTITRADGTTRRVTPRHIVFAHGFGGGVPNMPAIPGMDEFGGKIIHSSQHKSARDHVGKKVVVVGACTSGKSYFYLYFTRKKFTLAFLRTRPRSRPLPAWSSSTYIMSTKNGMPRLFKGFFWEGAPPTEVADRIWASYPNNVLRLMHQRVTRDIAEDDKELLAALKKRGFRVDFGTDGSGFLMKAYERGGGYYLDVGASKLIADGKIKLKNDSGISRFSKDAIGKRRVLFYNILVAQLAGEDVAAQVNTVWGLNEEGEVNTAWRWSGVPGLYFMMGNLAMCRYHSKHLALWAQTEYNINVQLLIPE
ncbi:hypothetical protein EW145_g8052 [Phellinidium pouzarii]|uniref:FAD/NAD(P)-binding domain-containing protein n=1 Tax=Phellinidium pouzarii TaxID=167371 RepID=A0A4S4KAL2_9AGAM|nr:hypothetical protein EW145_g8052 [Phellinidium pouzarii]